MSNLVSTIQVFEHQGHVVTTSLHIAKATGLPHYKVLRSIATQEKYYANLKRSDIFKRDFLLADGELFAPRLAEINLNKKERRGRKPKVYFLTKEGANAFIGSLTGERACEFRIMLAEAFSILERQNESLRTENMQLRAQLEAKPRRALRGPPAGTIRTPRMQVTLWDTVEVIDYEMKPKNEIDPHLLALSKLDLYHNMQRGLTVKVGEQLEILIKETAKDRAAVHQLADARFYCDDSKGNK